MSKKSEAVPIKVDRPLYERVKHYSDVTGVPMARVVREALGEWMDAVASVRLDKLTTNPPFGVN